MVPLQRGIRLQGTPPLSFPLSALVVEVQTCRLRGIQSVLTTTEPAAATAARKTAVAHIVGRAKAYYSGLSIHIRSHRSPRITFLRAEPEVNITKCAPVHAFFQSEVEYRRFLVVFYSCDTGQIASFIIGLHLVHNRSRQVFHRRLRITGHEFFSVHLHFLHPFAVDRHCSVVTHFGTRQFLHQFLHHRTLRRAIGGSVIDRRIFHHGHANGLCCHGGILQHDGIGPHHHRSQVHVGRIFYCDIPVLTLIAHARKAQDIATIFQGIQPERSVIPRQCTRHECRISSRKQLNRHLWYRIFRIAIHHLSRNLSVLSPSQGRHHPN